jgi:hypothetical protein
MSTQRQWQAGVAIDITYDFRTNSRGKDPDTHSDMLRRYHQLLWSKRLPSGEPFELAILGRYLHHESALGKFTLSSDAVIPTFQWVPHIKSSVAEAQLKDFNARGYTIGGMMVFPAAQIARQWTVNQARGCNRKIRDRFDLTLECIRRHYCGEPSPLCAVLARYERFFKLFEDFRGYVRFFLLQDLVSDDLTAVRFSAPFDNFERSPIPSVSEYEAYRLASLAFIDARNQRILEEASRG